MADLHESKSTLRVRNVLSFLLFAPQFPVATGKSSSHFRFSFQKFSPIALAGDIPNPFFTLHSPNQNGQLHHFVGAEH